MLSPSTKTVIVIPCYNEADRLNEIKFEQFIESNKDKGVLFVNDGSSDDTLRILQKIHDSHMNQIEILNLAKNVGKAEAVRMGMLYAIDNSSCDYYAFWDADLATPLNEINGFLKTLSLQNNLKAVMGSRISRLGSDIQRSWFRHYLGRVFATAVSLLFSIKVYDSQCGAKIFHRELAESIFETKFLSTWLFDVELLYRIKKKNCIESVYEYPLSAWKDVEGSKLKIRSYFGAIVDLFRIYFHYKPWKGQEE